MQLSIDIATHQILSFCLQHIKFYMVWVTALWLTHTVTHTRKKVDGVNGRESTKDHVHHTFWRTFACTWLETEGALALPDNGVADADQLHNMYDLTLRLQSQLLSVIYDVEIFGGADIEKHFAQVHSDGRNSGASVTLTIDEPLPSMKRMTEAIEEHWKAILHAAIETVAQQKGHPHFDKAMVEIEIITPKGSNNARLWDTSNQAINVIINNLKGIFLEDDNIEHMAFSVVGRWRENGVTIIRVLDLDELQRIRGIKWALISGRNHEFWKMSWRIRQSEKYVLVLGFNRSWCAVNWR